MGGEVAVTASTHNGTAWQPLPQLLSPNASLQLVSTAIKFRASVPDCNRALATLEYRSVAPLSPNEQELSFMTAVKTGWERFLAQFSKTEDFCPQEPIVLSSGVAAGGMLEDDVPWPHNAIETADDGYTQDEVLAQSNSVAPNQSMDSFAREECPGDSVLEDFHVDNYLQNVSATNGASDRDGGHDYAHVDSVWHSSSFSQDKGPANDTIQAVYTPYSGGYVQSTSLAEDNCPASDVIQAIHEADSSGPFNSNTDEGALEGIDYHCSDGYTLPGGLEAADQQILTTNLANEPENTDQIGGLSSLVSYELNHQVDKEMRYFKYSIVSGVPLFEEKSFSGDEEDVMPASVCPSLIDNNVNQQNMEDNQACNDYEGHSLDWHNNKEKCQSSEFTLEAAERSQKECINQLIKEVGGIDDVFSSMPFGDSSSSSHTCTSIEANADPERIMSTEPMIDLCGNLEEDMICEYNGNRSLNPPISSHPADSYEEMLQMPELKLVIELPEGSSLDEDMDPLDHINLVFSSLEKSADGSLVAVLRADHNLIGKLPLWQSGRT